MKQTPRQLWYSQQGGRTVDSVGVPIEDSSRSTRSTELRAKQAANTRTAQREPGLGSIARFANEGLQEQDRDLRAARQATRSAVRAADAKGKK